MPSIPDWGERFTYAMFKRIAQTWIISRFTRLNRLLVTTFSWGSITFSSRISTEREMMKRERKNFRYRDLQCRLTRIKFPISNHDIARVASVSAGKAWPQLKYRFTPWFTCRDVIINIALGAINTSSSCGTFSSRPPTSSDNQAISAKSFPQMVSPKLVSIG